MLLDVEVYTEEEISENTGYQAKYLAHGIDDLLWTDDFNEVISFFKGQLKEHGVENL